MKTPLLTRYFSALACIAITSTSLSSLSAADVNLTLDSSVRSQGSYTYYARGNGTAGNPVTPFSTTFYPGPPNAAKNDPYYNDGTLIDPGDGTATKVSFASGNLTDDNVTTPSYVGGWLNVTDIPGSYAGQNFGFGTFDILFDLGNSYNISRIEIVYQSIGGERWTTSTQYVYIANDLTAGGNAIANDSDFVLFGSTAFENQTNQSTAVIAGTDVARYVNLRLTTQVKLNDNDTSQGGKLFEIRIYGDPNPIPEPSTAVLLIGACAGALILFRRMKKR